MSKKVALINGPNLNLLGSRDASHYGTDSLETITESVKSYAKQAGYELFDLQSNIEGQLINAIHSAMSDCEGIIINAGGYSHTSIAIRDAVDTAEVPVVEVHLSNIYAREEFRHHSYLSAVCIGVISGFGRDSYRLALDAMLTHL